MSISLPPSHQELPTLIKCWNPQHPWGGELGAGLHQPVLRGFRGECDPDKLEVGTGPWNVRCQGAQVQCEEPGSVWKFFYKVRPKESV